MPNSPRLESQRIAVDRRGAGPAVVLIHGLGDSAETWGGLRPYLDGFETWAWDMLGHGRSAKPTKTSAYSMQGALDDLEDVIESVGRDVVLIGHSLGGYLSQHRAVRDLSSLRGLVLIATGPGYRDPTRREQWNQRVRKAAARFEVPDAAAQMAEQHDELVMANLERLTLPVLQIIGERDTQYHGAFEVVKRRVPGVESLRVPDAGHHVHSSHAAQVGPVVRSFLKRLP
ncbi:MAG: alpha/beta fold hydrolase [Deltaproteobacteria bacterium]|nr:alpha/beta fold hydrolase [Deltaproteobacteria bacterium]